MLSPRSQHRTDLSWPKNTINILGSLLCSLMVQDANTPKPTSYTQSLAPKETLCLHHMKSWICIQSQPERNIGSGRILVDGREKTQTRRARLGLLAELSWSKTCWGAGRFGGCSSIPPHPFLVWEELGLLEDFLMFSQSEPPHSYSWCSFLFLLTQVRFQQPSCVLTAHKSSLSPVSWWLPVELDSQKVSSHSGSFPTLSI